MIDAIASGKAQINKNEDVKTSSILGLMTLLPAELFWKLLRGSISESYSLPRSSGDILNTQFWPHWSINGKDLDVTNNNFVEPDVFIKFEQFDVIIEAKLDGNPQYENQWNNEVCAYKYNISKDKPLIFVALGGNASLDVQPLTKGRHKGTLVYKCSWNRLLEVIHAEAEYLKQAQFQYDRHVLRILHMIERSFSIYGEKVTLWMESIPEELTTININSLNNIREIWNHLK